MRDAVIVSYARPGLAKSVRGGFTITPGAALAGPRCVVAYQIPSLLYLVLSQIATQAQKLALMTGGQAKVPVVYLVPGSGARLGLAAQHSDHPYSLFAHVGVNTVLPSTPADAYGLMLSAIRDDDPVLYLAPAAVLTLLVPLAAPAFGVAATVVGIALIAALAVAATIAIGLRQEREPQD